MKKFFCTCLYALGAIGGFGLALAEREWVIAAGCLALAVLAFPTLKRMYEE